MATIPERKLGSQGMKASAQGLGCMGMSAFYNDKDHKASEEESIKVIHRAKELGVTHLDTAIVYGMGHNESLVGKAIKGRHNEYTVASKFAFKISDKGEFSVDGTPDFIRESCNASLERLGLDTVDLYYQHRVDPNTSIESTVGELKKLVEEGKIKYIGLSEVSVADLRRAHNVHPITAVQVEYSLWFRDIEEDLLPACRELGIGVVAYSPLGRGFLAGKYKSLDNLEDGDFRKTNPRFTGEGFQKNLKLLSKVEELAKSKGVTAGQLALAWVHHQGDDIFPIPGTKRLSYLEENAAAFHIKLSAEELKLLEEAVPASEVVGDRYEENMMAMTYRNVNSKAHEA
jgi:aryl-alcohol dehydrogenase-like predicted oxidoreductase